MQWQHKLSEFSTFGIGGPIRHLIEADSVNLIREAFSFAAKEKLPLLIVGKGSNCLFPDQGFDGVVLVNRIDFCTFSEPLVEVGAGYSFSLLGAQAAKRGLSGLEFASGIPASVGGAVFMNAGANGQETVTTLHSVRFIGADGSDQTLLAKDLKFAYRHSPFQSMSGCIVSATFALIKDETARSRQLTLLTHRLKTQPGKEKSAGCVFRNPSTGLSAGALIDRCQLKGERIGGAKVSEIHANFIVNDAAATCADVRQLIAHVQKTVQEQTGVWLEPEIRII
jgi:UDP-N-acetylmuramate dehydrogenase